MLLKRLPILICAVMAFNIAASGVCFERDLLGVKAFCKSKTNVDGAWDRAGAGDCRMVPCHGQKDSPFLLPDTTRRFDPERRMELTANQAMEVTATAGHHRQAGIDSRQPPAFKPPPLFFLFCSLIC
jgi:hypothetical protein